MTNNPRPPIADIGDVFHAVEVIVDRLDLLDDLIAFQRIEELLPFGEMAGIEGRAGAVSLAERALIEIALQHPGPFGEGLEVLVAHFLGTEQPAFLTRGLGIAHHHVRDRAQQRADHDERQQAGRLFSKCRDGHRHCESRELHKRAPQYSAQ